MRTHDRFGISPTRSEGGSIAKQPVKWASARDRRPAVRRLGRSGKAPADVLFHPEELVELTQRVQIRDEDLLIDDPQVAPVAELLDGSLDGVDVEPDAG